MVQVEQELEEEIRRAKSVWLRSVPFRLLILTAFLGFYFCFVLLVSPTMILGFINLDSWDSLIAWFYGLALLILTLKRFRQGARWQSFFQWPDLYCFVLVLLTLKVHTLSSLILGLRLSLMLLIYAVRYWVGRMLLTYIRHHPSLTLVASFVGMILVGTGLLILPQATVDGQGASFMTALFTMTSAICVTGLTVVDTGTYFSLFGHAVILLGFQTGALAIMILSSLIALFVGGLLRSSRRGSLGRYLDVTDGDSLRRFVMVVCALTFLIELIGAVFIFISWQGTFANIQDAIWWSLFHAVSAFCNAGFALNADSLAAWSQNGSMVFSAGALIVFGGLGFAILVDVVDQGFRWWRQPRSWWGHLHIQTRVVLMATLLLNGFSMIFLLFFEFDGVFSGLSITEKLYASFFHSVTLRTAGLSVVSVDTLSSPSIVFSLIAMFVGAGSGSTAGGIKITTAVVVLMSLRAMLRGREDVQILGATIPRLIVYRSMCITFFGLGFLFVSLLILMHSQHIVFEKILFEAVSAFGTVGLSMGVTPQLDTLGRMLIIFLMFVGRIGPLTLALAIGENRMQAAYKYPHGDVAVG